MTEQEYNYLDRTIQDMSGFFETQEENLEAPASDVKKPPKKKKKMKNSRKRKALFLEDSNKDPSENEKLQSREKFCQCHGRCSHSTDKCTILESLIEKAKANMSKGHKEWGKKMYTKHEVNVPIERELKRSFKGKRKPKQELHTFEKMHLSGSKKSV